MIGGKSNESESEYVIERYGNMSATSSINTKEKLSVVSNTSSDNNEIIETKNENNLQEVTTISEGGGLSDISTSESDVFIKPENKNEIVNVRIINKKIDNVNMTYNLKADELTGGSEDDSDVFISNRVLRSGMTDLSQTESISERRKLKQK